MKKLIAITAFLIAMPAAAWNVKIDYARNVNFETLERFQHIEATDVDLGFSDIFDVLDGTGRPGAFSH